MFAAVDEHADIAVVVVTYNSSSDVLRLIEDLRLVALDRPIRVVVVDNSPSDDTASAVRAHADVTFVDAGGNLGYAGGINAGLPYVRDCDAVLILNPDLTLGRGAVGRLLGALRADERIGAVVPCILDETGATYPSVRREPSLSRSVGDAVLGGHLRWRPGFLAETDHRLRNYDVAHDVDWATGAAILIRGALVRQLGDWNLEYFLYSEETDYFRRVRENGYRVRFEPSAVVTHRRGGSGTSPALDTLMAVNRVRYVERHHGRLFSVCFRGTAALAELLRSYDSAHRRTLAVLLSRRRWSELPHSTQHAPEGERLTGPLRRGAVVVPAHNESAVITRTLTALSRAVVDGYFELIVVCNGCSDDTADVVRGIRGMRVVELAHGSKPAALNAGDEEATLWPRLYLDADIRISAEAVLSVLDRLEAGDILVARPTSRYDAAGASGMVRSYYRARQRIPQHKTAMWGAGVYGLSEEGHERIGRFPTATGDDFFVDTQFAAGEKAVVPTVPSVVTTPTNITSLLAILTRYRRGNVELLADEGWREAGRAPWPAPEIARAVVGSISGPKSAVDAAVYLGMAVAARCAATVAAARVRSGVLAAARWERDDSSRTMPS